MAFDLVILRHQRHGLSDQLVRLTDQVFEQVRHVERDALGFFAGLCVNRIELMQRVFQTSASWRYRN